MFRTHATQIGSAFCLLFILLASASCGGPTANTSGPPPARVPSVGGAETVPWSAASDPGTELSQFSFEKPWQVMIPDTAKIVLPRIAGRLVVAWDEKGGRATVIDLRDGHAVGSLSVPGVAKARITSIDISPDGRCLAAADAARPSSALRCWSVDSGQETTIPLEKPEQAVVRFLASDRLLLATQTLPDLGQIQLSVWNVKTQERLASYAVPTQPGFLLDDRNIAVSSGGRYCAILSGEVLSLYDAATGRCQGRIVADTAFQRAWPTCRGLAFSADGTELVAMVEATSIIRLYGWDLASGAPRFRQDVPQAAASVALNGSQLGPELAWSPDGWVLFGTAITNGQTLTQTEQAPPRCHRLLNQQNALVIDTGYRDGRQRELALVSRDALALPATASRGPTEPAAASRAPAQPTAEAPATWATPPGPAPARRQVAENLSLELPPWTSRVGYSYLPSPHAVVEGRERFVEYDLGNGLPVREVRKHEDESKTATSRPLCVSPNGRLFAALGFGLDVWSFDAGRSVRIPEDGNTVFMAFPREDMLLTAGMASPTSPLCVKLWNVPAGTLRVEFESRPQRSRLPSALAMSPGGIYLATVETMAGLDAQLCLYEILTGRLVARSAIEPGPDRASIGHWYGLAFSDDGTRLAGAWDYHGSPAIRFASWDATTGKCQATAELGEAAALYGETPIADLPWGESLKWNATGGGWLLFHTTHVDDQGKVAARLPRVAVRERDRLLLSQDRMLALVRSDQHASGLLTVLKLSSDVDQQLHLAMARISSPPAKEAPPPGSPAAVAQAEPPRPAATAPRQPSQRQPSEEPPPPAWKAAIDPPTQPVAVKLPPRPIRAARLATFLYPRQPSPYVAMVE
nr:hypothetical protein [Pirellulaceae bacterium]